MPLRGTVGRLPSDVPRRFVPHAIRVVGLGTDGQLPSTYKRKGLQEFSQPCGNHPCEAGFTSCGAVGGNLRRNCPEHRGQWRPEPESSG